MSMMKIMKHSPTVYGGCGYYILRTMTVRLNCPKTFNGVRVISLWSSDDVTFNGSHRYLVVPIVWLIVTLADLSLYMLDFDVGRFDGLPAIKVKKARGAMESSAM